MTVQQDIQTFDPGQVVELFELDTSQYDGQVHRFCSSVHNAAAVIYGGNTYAPYPVEASGFSKASTGSLPQPKLVLADVSGAFYSMIKTYDDLLGSKLTRLRTLKKYLDGEPGADPTAKFPDEVYYVERKSNQNRFMTEFTLSALMDLQGLKLPRRLVLKNICTHRYRRWTGSAWDYSQATCPYTGTTYFNALGESTTQANDKCGKRLSDCQLRYPSPASLPTRAFPGVLNVRR